MIDCKDGEKAIQIWPCQPRKLALEDVFSGEFQVKKFVPSSIEKYRFPPPNLQDMRDTIRRVAPWVTAAYLVPRLFGADGLSWGGVCLNRDSSLIIPIYASTISPTSIMSALHHEIFHATQPKLSPEFKSAFYGNIWTNASNFGCGYLDSSIEQTARLYENFAAYIESGGQVFIHRDDWLNQFLNAVYSGQFAVEVLASERKCADDLRKHKRRTEMISRIKSKFMEVKKNAWI